MATYHHLIQYYETDKMGITHHSNYVRWMEEARTHLLAEIGFPYDELEKGGLISPVVAVSVSYLAPTTFMEEVVITVNVEQVKAAKLKLSYKMRDSSGRMVCQALSEHSFLDPHHQFVNLKKDFPNFFKALKLLEGSELG